MLFLSHSSRVEESSESCLPKLLQGVQSSVLQQPHSHVTEPQTGWMGYTAWERLAGPTASDSVKLAISFSSGSILGHILFKSCISDQAKGMNQAVNRFVDGIKLGEQSVDWRGKRLFRRMWIHWENGPREILQTSRCKYNSRTCRKSNPLQHFRLK